MARLEPRRTGDYFATILWILKSDIAYIHEFGYDLDSIVNTYSIF